MLDFDYSIPTKVFFGRNKIERIAKEIKKYADRILLVFGGGSIKKSGLYDTVTEILNKKGITYKELSGVAPNPRIKSVRQGVEICRENKFEFILAVGGGSVIDCSKAIAAGFYYNADPWDFFSKKVQVPRALPLGTILTLAAAGSEMNGLSVISNEQTKEKLATGSDFLRPRFSILDPTYTFTVSQKYTAAGVVDIYSHILEQYFCSLKDAFVQDRLAEALIKVCLKYGPIVMEEPKNYEARANLMWAGSLALNGILTYGKVGDWAAHHIEHAISAVYDITHGIGLAIIVPNWMEYVLSGETVDKFAEYAKNIFGIESKNKFEAAKKGIEKTREFFKSLGMPASLGEVGIDHKKISEIAGKATIFGNIGEFKELNTNDVERILEKVL
ncbi:MAG: iron-containing alcohol dehydrogenase [Candidatus Omnitrophota bacterium]